LVAWLQTHHIQQVVMESTGIYWKSVFAHLEAAGIPALVVNAFHVKPYLNSKLTLALARR
jgi:transposase